LDITCNNLTHEGAKHLSDALMSDKCKLIELDIRPMKIDIMFLDRPRPHGIYLPHENFSLFIIFEK
jgi:hypothetical protein